MHVFLATSAIHRQYKLNMAQEEILRTRRRGRADRARAVRGRRVLARGRLAHRAGVPRAGGRGGDRGRRHARSTFPTRSATPCRMSSRSCSATCARTCAASISIRLSVHCHDDLGMAVANSLTAVVAGARQIECTINGIGERAGNCSLEEVVMALKTREAFFNVTHRHPDQPPLSRPRAWSRASPGMPIPRNKAVVGENAFAHEAGIHQHGMLQASLHLRDPASRGCGPVAQPPGTRQAQRPARVPRPRAGSWASSSTSSEFNRVFEEFKALADKKKELFDGDIEALGAARGRLGQRALEPASICRPSRT